MFLYNGQPFDIDVLNVIGDVQYPVGWFYDASVRATFGLVEISDPVAPATSPTQIAIQNGFAETNGVWSAVWTIRDRTADELAQYASQLAGAKIAKNQEINEARLNANFSVFTYADKQIACDTLSRSDIDGIANQVALTGSFPAGFPNAWKCVDNSYLSIPDVATFKLMYEAMTTQGITNFGHSQTLKTTLASATTLEQVTAIVW